MKITGNERKNIDIGISVTQTLLQTVKENFYLIGDNGNVDFCNYLSSLIGLLQQDNEIKVRSENIAWQF